MAMRFVKMHGIGNDYIYISGFDQPIPDDPSALAVRIADRHFGVGGDGLILVLPPEPGSEADAVMRMFNADGSEGGMCGNGIRCVAKFLYDGGYVRAPRIRVKTKGAGVLSLDLEIDPASDRVRRVRVEMGAPILRASAIPTTLPGDPPLDHPIAVTYDGKTITYRGTAVSMGNPHLVMFVEDVASIDLERIGPLLERHEAFPRCPGGRARRSADADLGARLGDYLGLRHRRVRGVGGRSADWANCPRRADSSARRRARPGMAPRRRNRRHDWSRCHGVRGGVG